MEKFLAMYIAMQSRMQSVLRNEKGATMVEYALMIVGVALIAIVGAKVLGGDLSTKFKDIGTSLTAQ